MILPDIRPFFDVINEVKVCTKDFLLQNLFSTVTNLSNFLKTLYLQPN
jgi:hypothetical protein